MGLPERGALRPLALLLLLLLQLQHLEAAADPLRGGQGACGRSPAQLYAAGAANKARPGGRGEGCAGASEPGPGREAPGWDMLLGTQLSLNLP